MPYAKDKKGNVYPKRGCNECGSLNYTIEKTAVMAMQYKNGKKVTERRNYLLAESRLLCDDCGAERVMRLRERGEGFRRRA